MYARRNVRWDACAQSENIRRVKVEGVPIFNSKLSVRAHTEFT